MARTKTPIAIIPPKRLTAAEMISGVVRLNKRIEELRAYDVTSSAEWAPAPLVALEKAIEDTLERIFGQGTSQFNRYSSAAHLRYESVGFFVISPGYSTPDPTASEVQDSIRGHIANSISLLEQAVRTLEEDLNEQQVEPALSVPQSQTKREVSRKVFVVHGHDEGAKEKVARYLTKIGFDPIILHEQANAGQTVIEKFEKHSDVGFAVVLLTPDDVGSEIGGTPAPRARQNVILELGYFMGRLGRTRVCALKSGELEVPSDYAGVVYEQMDAAGAWKTALARELEAAGHQVDWNTVMRP